MDFFESQDDARRKTSRLVVLFVLAVVSIIVSVYLVVTAAFALTGEPAGADLWRADLFVAVVVATLAIVTFGTLYKIAQLRGGGRVVAESLGGRLISRDSQDPGQRRILNVVEEMAIASGTPVPPVYLMPGEKGINAFAAGYTPNDAVIGVTAGTLEQLNRSELQGVIAHEFSHILNGDMRLNIRLIGILNGILVIGLVGYFILRSAAYGGRVRSRGRNGGSAVVAILAVGAGLTVVGFMGTLFGNLIKAAVSRQREYLADASAVQFTRDPGSIAGALMRIGSFASGSGIASPHAAEASHLFFARALTSGLNSMFATHPPLEDRIRRIDPGWDGAYPPPRVVGPEEPAPGGGRRRPAGIDVAEVVTGAAILAGAGAGAGTGSGSGAVSQIGQPTTAHVEYAAALVRALPEPVVAAAREPYGARAVIYAMLLDPDPGVRRVQLRHLEEHADEGVQQLLEELIGPMDDVAPEARLPLVDLTTPVLGELTASQYSEFRANVVALEQADAKVSLFEWVLGRMILRHLDPRFRKVETARVHYYSLARLERHCAVLLSALSHTGHDDPAAARFAFEQGRSRLDLPRLELLDRGHSDLEALDEALAVLETVAFRLKRSLLDACAACVSADRHVTIVEGELLRGIADALGCPMPPLLPGQPVS